MADKQVKIVGKHVKGCYALRNERDGTWDTCWGPLSFGGYGDPVVKTWRKYGKKGRVLNTWLRYICNNGGCRAELHVNSDFVLRAASTTTASKGRE